MSECTHDCETCGQTCEKKEFMAKPLPSTKIGKMIAVMSGKGGVGKSMVTDLLAVNTLRSGRSVAVLDADITGPSVPKAFGITEKATGTEDEKINPVITKQGVKIMSMNLLLPEDNDPVVWRGPVISGAVKQFFTDVYWDNVDYMYVDMPPGRSAHGVSVAPCGRNRNSHHPAGSRFDDCGQSRENGRDDEHKDSRDNRKYELRRMSGLQNENLPVREKQTRRSRGGVFVADSWQTSDNFGTFRTYGQRRNRKRRKLSYRRDERYFRIKRTAF